VSKALLTEILERIAANVRRTRLRRGLTQEELAEKSDMAVEHLQRIERGASPVSLRGLASIAKVLDVDPALLMKAAKPIKRLPGRPRSRR
jgi:transcriptional regulator with XRE-family HTH domain